MNHSAGSARSTLPRFGVNYSVQLLINIQRLNLSLHSEAIDHTKRGVPRNLAG